MKHEATDALLRQQVDQLQHKLTNTQRERDELASAKNQVDIEINSLLSVAQNSSHVIGESIKRNKALRSQKHAALAQVETLLIDLVSSEAREEKLEEEVALLKAALSASTSAGATVKPANKESDVRAEELVHRP
jgi:chromosome segregation ATPase